MQLLQVIRFLKMAKNKLFLLNCNIKNPSNFNFRLLGLFCDSIKNHFVLKRGIIHTILLQEFSVAVIQLTKNP